jgi:hypothetical protein
MLQLAQNNGHRIWHTNVRKQTRQRDIRQDLIKRHEIMDRNSTSGTSKNESRMQPTAQPNENNVTQDDEIALRQGRQTGLRNSGQPQLSIRNGDALLAR